MSSETDLDRANMRIEHLKNQLERAEGALSFYMECLSLNIQKLEYDRITDWIHDNGQKARDYFEGK